MQFRVTFAAERTEPAYRQADAQMSDPDINPGRRHTHFFASLLCYYLFLFLLACGVGEIQVF
jgi:hypothetical protein